MSTIYRKDASARILMNCDGDVDPQPFSKAPSAEAVRARNHHGRVYLNEGEAFQVIVKIGSDELVVCSGTSHA